VLHLTQEIANDCSLKKGIKTKFIKHAEQAGKVPLLSVDLEQQAQRTHPAPTAPPGRPLQKPGQAGRARVVSVEGSTSAQRGQGGVLPGNQVDPAARGFQILSQKVRICAQDVSSAISWRPKR